MGRQHRTGKSGKSKPTKTNRQSITSTTKKRTINAITGRRFADVDHDPLADQLIQDMLRYMEGPKKDWFDE